MRFHISSIAQAMGWVWAFVAFVGLSQCSPSAFSVQNDLLAYPQFEVVYSESFIGDGEAEARLAFAESPSQERGDQYVAAAAPAAGTSPDLSLDLNTQEWDLNGVRYPTSSKDTHERMILDRRPFLCTIPHIQPLDNNSSKPHGSEEEQQQELIRASENGWELLKGLEGKCLYWPTFGRSWWVYSFCYNEGIRQFHPMDPGRGIPPFPPVEDPHVPSFDLGKFEPRKSQQSTAGKQESDKQDISTKVDSYSTSPHLETRGETNYLVQTLGGGTVCDLTGYKRQVEVQFHCNPTLPDRIRLIKETASCVYLIVIDTPRLCNDVAFRPPQVDKPHPISCQEIIAPERIEKWKVAKAAQARAILNTQEEEEAEGSYIPLVIGDIVVGAQKLVGGSPEKTIKASKIVSALQKTTGDDQQGEKEIAVLARSDGKHLYMTTVSEREMKNLGLDTTPRDIRRWIDTIQDAADGKVWKLVAVKRPDGAVIFKMIIGTEEDGQDAAREPPKRGKKPSLDAKEGNNDENVGSEEEYK